MIHEFLQGQSDLYIGKEAECRRFIDAVLWITRTGAKWRMLPVEYGNWNDSPPRDERFVAISSGRGWYVKHVCGLRDYRTVVCWGSNNRGQSSPPEHQLDLRDEPFTEISTGSDYTCGLRRDGVAVCWGSNNSGQSSTPEGERFVQISSGRSHTCGLRDDGVIVCWGDNSEGQSSPPLR